MEDSDDLFIVIFFVVGIALTIAGIYIFKKFILIEKKEPEA